MSNIAVYAFTWNPNPARFINLDPDYVPLIMEHMKVLKPLLDNVNKIYPELSPSGKLHYHGVITIPTDPDEYQRFYCKYLKRLKRMGFVKIKPVTKFDEWVKYCTKDIDKLKSIFKDIPIYPLVYVNVRKYYAQVRISKFDDFKDTGSYDDSDESMRLP